MKANSNLQLRRGSPNRSIVLGLATVVFATGSIFALSIRNYSRGGSSSNGNLTAASTTQPATNARILFTPKTVAKTGDKSSDNIEVEVISIGRWGFQPKEIRRPAGPFVLGIENQLGPTQFNLEIYRVHGQKLHELNLKKGQVHERQILNLPPGEYLLRETGHPHWECSLFLSAK